MCVVNRPLTFSEKLLWVFFSWYEAPVGKGNVKLYISREPTKVGHTVWS